MFFGADVPNNVPVPCRERLCRSRHGRTRGGDFGACRRVGGAHGVLGYSGGLRGLGADAPKARATIKVVRLRCLGMAVCGQFLAVSNRFLAVCGQFGQFRMADFGPFSRFWPLFGLFWPGRGARHRADARPLTGAAIGFWGAASIVRVALSRGAPIDKLRTLCRAPSRPPRPLAAPRCGSRDQPHVRRGRRAHRARFHQIYSYLSMYNSS